MDQAHIEQIDYTKTGKTYRSGVALAAATRQAKVKHTASGQNPKGTPKHLPHCTYYHTSYYTALGHTIVANECYGVYNCTKDERMKIMSIVKGIFIEEEL